MKINHGKLYIDGEEFDGVLHIPEFENYDEEYKKEVAALERKLKKNEPKRIEIEVNSSVFNCRCNPIRRVDYYINIPVETQIQIIRKAIEKFMGR